MLQWVAQCICAFSSRLLADGSDLSAVDKKYLRRGYNPFLVRVEVVETSSQVWKTCILTAVLHSQNTESIITQIMSLAEKILLVPMLGISTTPL